jgi:hypothetical protein
MPASRYDIYAEQGTTFKLHFQYKYKNGTPIDLTGFSGALQVRRSQRDDKVLLYLTENGVTGGGVTGDFTVNSDGVGGTGGIYFNTAFDGTTAGATGGILIKIDASTMKNVPAGKHFYDFELINTESEVTRLIEGSFENAREITRT